MFDLVALEEGTRFPWLDASANPRIAKLLDTDCFRSALESAQDLAAAEPETKMEFDGKNVVYKTGQHSRTRYRPQVAIHSAIQFVTG